MIHESTLVEPEDDPSLGGEFRLFGPPGTGKTTFLSDQARKWARDVGYDKIIIASFTRAAAAEIASRGIPVTRGNIGTLHALAYRSIDSPEIAETHLDEFSAEHPTYRLGNDRPDLDDGVDAPRGNSTEGDDLQRQYETLRARLTPRELWPASVRNFADVWERWRTGNGYVDFTGMIEAALEANTWAPGNPTVGLFDEAQDFTPLELALVRSWGSHMQRVLLAGDDDQTIYAFKGATPDAFLDPPVEETHKRVLRQSHRVPVAVHTAASRWVERLTRREPKLYEPRDEAGSIRVVRSTYRSPETIVEEAALAAGDGQTSMFLGTCSYMLDPIKAVLRREGVPFHNPYRRRRGDWNPLAPPAANRTTASQRLLAYLRPRPEVWGDESRLWTGGDLKAWTAHLQAKGFLRHGAKKLLDGLAPDIEIDDTALSDMFAALPEEDWPGLVNADLDWFDGRLLSTKRQGYEFPLQIARRRGAATLREEPRIVVGTIHSVKGGEADNVYLFPDLSIAGRREWHGHDTARDSVVRLFYVGMTRARSDLIVCSPATSLAIDPYTLAGPGAVAR